MRAWRGKFFLREFFPCKIPCAGNVRPRFVGLEKARLSGGIGRLFPAKSRYRTSEVVPPNQKPRPASLIRQRQWRVVEQSQEPRIFSVAGEFAVFLEPFRYFVAFFHRFLQV